MQADASFITVSGIGRRISRTGEIAPQLVYRASKGDRDFEATSIQNMYDALMVAQASNRLKAEVLGLMLDESGEMIREIEADNRKFVYPNQISLLKLLQEKGFVWIVASRLYKAEAVLLAIKKGYATALVIDREIADYLKDK